MLPFNTTMSPRGLRAPDMPIAALKQFTNVNGRAASTTHAFRRLTLRMCFVLLPDQVGYSYTFPAGHRHAARGMDPRSAFALKRASAAN